MFKEFRDSLINSIKNIDLHILKFMKRGNILSCFVSVIGLVILCFYLKNPTSYATFEMGLVIFGFGIVVEFYFVLLGLILDTLKN